MLVIAAECTTKAAFRNGGRPGVVLRKVKPRYLLAAVLLLTAGQAIGQPVAFDADRLRVAAARLPQLHTLRVSHRGVAHRRL